MQYCLANVHICSGTNASTSCKNVLNIDPVVFVFEWDRKCIEFTTVKDTTVPN